METPQISRRDSANVGIVEFATRELGTTDTLRLSSKPDLEIGANELGTGIDVTLHDVTGARVLPTGQVLIVERSGAVRFFGADGRVVKEAGGRGDGPGEFRGSPALVPSPSTPEEVVLYDSALRRLTILSSTGDYLGIVALPTVLRAHPIGRIVGTLLLKGNPQELSRGAGVHASPVMATYAVYDMDRATVDTVGVFQDQQWFTHLDPGTGSSAMFAVPFDVPIHEAFDTAGFYLLPGETASGAMFHYNRGGRLDRILRPAEPMSAPDGRYLDRYIAAQQAAAEAPALRALYGRIYEDIQLPKAVPRFDRIVGDEIGRVWARSWEPESTRDRVWLGFDQEGEIETTMILPSGLTLLQVGRDFVFGSWRNSLGIESVRRYNIHPERN